MRKTRKYISCVAIKKLEREVRKVSHCGTKQQWRSASEVTLLFLVRVTSIYVLLSEAGNCYFVNGGAPAIC